MRFGSVDMFVDLGDWAFRMGRPLGNEGFLKSLLKYGNFQSFHFFCPDVQHMKKFRGRLEELVPGPSLSERVEISLQVALAETIAENDFHVFHVGDFTYYMPYLIGIRNRVARSPFPITGVTHSLDGVFMNLRYLELILAQLAPFDGIVCSSQSAQKTVEKGFSWIQQQLQHRFGVVLENPVKLRQIPFGIEEEFFQEKEDREEARAFLQIPPDSVVILSVGRISLRQKTDWSPLLELVAKMDGQNELPGVILVIAGGATPADVTLLESLIQRLGLGQKVLLLPNFSPEAKKRLYRAADIFLSLVDNFQETFGLTVLEAMASGLPVILSDFSGYREFIQESQEGFLIPTTWLPNLPDFLAQNLGILDPSIARLSFAQSVSVDLDRTRQAILHLVRDRTLRRQMGEKGKLRATSYQWPKVIAAYETFWTDLRKEAASRPFVPSRAPDLLCGHPAETFSHYPSRLLREGDFLFLTGTGKQALEDPTCLTRYEDVLPCLFAELEEFLLSALTSRPQTVADLRRLAAESLEATPGQVDFHIQWLLKHGALALAEATPPAD